METEVLKEFLGGVLVAPFSKFTCSKPIFLIEEWLAHTGEGSCLALPAGWWQNWRPDPQSPSTTPAAAGHRCVWAEREVPLLHTADELPEPLIPDCEARRSETNPTLGKGGNGVVQEGYHLTCWMSEWPALSSLHLPDPTVGVQESVNEIRTSSLSPRWLYRRPPCEGGLALPREVADEIVGLECVQVWIQQHWKWTQVGKLNT